MNNRERFLHTLTGRPCDRPPLWEGLGVWDETEARWRSEGLPAGAAWNHGQRFDAGIAFLSDGFGLRLGLMPWFPHEVLSEDGDSRTVRDAFGIVKRESKTGNSIPQFLSNPVTGWQDWTRLKQERLQPGAHRLPAGFDAWAAEMERDERFLVLGDYPYGLFGTLRDLMGLENFLIGLYEQPDLIHDIMGHLTDLWISAYEPVAARLPIGAIHMWEDMSGKQGPLMSPNMVREFMAPQYRRIAAWGRAHGIPVLSVDTDGDVQALVPVFAEAGVNCMFPFEAVGRMELLDYRREYPDLAIMGGINKRALEGGKESIDRELAKVERMLAYGRFVPAPDHAVHPGVSYTDYLYYMKRLRAILGVREE